MLYNKKTLVQSVVEPTDTNVYWVQVIPNSTDIPIIKIFHNGAWIPLTGTPASIQDLLDLKAPLHNPKFTGDATLNGEPISTNDLNGTNYLLVYGTGTPEENAAELQAAYNEAKTKRITENNGFVIGKTYYKDSYVFLNNPSNSYGVYKVNTTFIYKSGNPAPNYANMTNLGNGADKCPRCTIIVAPGKYTFNNANDFTIDTPFVDIVSLTGNRDVQINGIKVTAGRNVLIKGIDCGTNPIQLSNCLENTLMFENCKGGDNSFSTDDSDLFGTFIDCKAGCSSFNVTDDVSATSKFIRCEADYNSFGNSCYHLYGYFEDCIGTSGCFGQTAKNGTTEVGAEFIGCKATNYSFGYNSILTGAKFINCEADSNSFGGGDQEYDGDASIDSTTEFINCKAIGSHNFGSGRCNIVSAKFNNCTGGSNSFYGGTLPGELINCKLTAGTFPTPTGAVKIYNCIDGSGNLVNYPVTNTATSKRLILSLTQTEVNAPTYTVIHNDFGPISHTTYLGIGMYRIFFVSNEITNLSKAFIKQNMTLLRSDGGGVSYHIMGNLTANSIDLNTFVNDNNIDGLLDNTIIEVEMITT